MKVEKGFNISHAMKKRYGDPFGGKGKTEAAKTPCSHSSSCSSHSSCETSENEEKIEATPKNKKEDQIVLEKNL